MNLRSPLSRVRYLGSAKDGTQHWWAQRLSALALIPLSIWFVASVLSLIGASHQNFALWAGGPFTASLLILLILATFYHAWLGLQVVVEDYVHSSGLKLALLLLIKAACILLATIGVISVLILLFQ
ncbi:succinate dehydrogenase, hydrophobic membrane anchor protein [Fodinicurvata halophila]|uniref:Succinate dehydrogenase hydrophobic membrane anchor subunit n=1 Tax=Fodinicurvata halophila TaxID=1419723 RepID=A0ABV8UMK8_9PROT